MLLGAVEIAPKGRGHQTRAHQPSKSFYGARVVIHKASLLSYKVAFTIITFLTKLYYFSSYLTV
jgi:hypothetical protein